MTHCDSCGRETQTADLVDVQRAYFFHADDPDPQIQPEVERWCVSCCSTYPHVEAESEAG